MLTDIFQKLCSQQSEQSDVLAPEVQEAVGTPRGSLRTHQIPRHQHEQTLSRAARSTVRLRFQTRQIRPATEQPTAGFSNTICLTTDVASTTAATVFIDFLVYRARVI